MLYEDSLATYNMGNMSEWALRWSTLMVKLEKVRINYKKVQLEKPYSQLHSIVIHDFYKINIDL